MLPSSESSSTEKVGSALYQQESRRVLATLIRLLGDFELAEEVEKILNDLTATEKLDKLTTKNGSIWKIKNTSH